MEETTGEIGNDFSMNIAKSWEKAFFETKTNPKTLKTALRTSIVLGNNGGAFIPLKTSSKIGIWWKTRKRQAIYQLDSRRRFCQSRCFCYRK